MDFHGSERSHQKLCHVSGSVSRCFQRFDKAFISNFVENLAVAKGNAKATSKQRSRGGYAKGSAKQLHIISIVFLSWF